MTISQTQRLKMLGLWPQWQLRPEYAPASHATADTAEQEPFAPADTDRLVAPCTTAEVATPQVATDSLPMAATDRRSHIMQLQWEPLLTEIRACQSCGLAHTRTQAVPGVGDQQADWLVIGEAPGADEDAKGEPFVGQAGKLLDNMLAAIGLQRGRGVYIANVLKCRPPENRNPADHEITACEPFLARQIELLQPKIILALGKFAAQWLLGSEQSIAGLRGKVHYFKQIPVVVTYHPAYLLRSLPEKAKAWEDLCLARESMKTNTNGEAR